jgi:hypothetical protein
MESASRDITYESCLVYLAKVMVTGRTFQEHLLNLRKVFHHFQEGRLKLHSEKCQLFQTEVQYLGHTVSPKGITTGHEKLKALRE